MYFVFLFVVAQVALVLGTNIPINTPTNVAIRADKPTDVFVIIPENARLISTVSPAGAFEVYARLNDDPSTTQFDFKLEKRGLMLFGSLEPSIKKRILNYKIYSKTDKTISFTATSTKVKPIKMDDDFVTFPQLEDYTYATYKVRAGDTFSLNVTSRDALEFVNDFEDFPDIKKKSKTGTNMMIVGVVPDGSSMLFVGARRASTCNSCGNVRVEIATTSPPITLSWYIWMIIGFGVLVIVGALFTSILCGLVCCGVIAAPLCCSWLISRSNNRDSPQTPVLMDEEKPAVIYTQPGAIQYYSSQEPILQPTYQTIYPSSYHSI
jgi:hypothetical protein